MTKKELLEAIKDMPEDAEVELCVHDKEFFIIKYHSPITNVVCHKKTNTICIC